MKTDSRDQAHASQKEQRGLYSILQSVDRRLELVVKILGYLSVLVVTPLFFIATVIGVDVYSWVGIKQMSEAQRAVVADLQAKGWAVDSEGSLKAMLTGESAFNSFMFAGIQPNPSDAAQAVKGMILLGQQPPLSSPEFMAYISSNTKLTGEVKQLSRELSSVLGRIEQDETLSANQFCEYMSAFLEAGDYRFEIEGDKSCILTAERGDSVPFILTLYSALKGWNEVLPDLELAPLNEESLLGFAVQSSERSLKMGTYVASRFPAIDLLAARDGDPNEGNVGRFTTILTIVSQDQNLTDYDNVTSLVLANGVNLSRKSASADEIARQDLPIMQLEIDFSAIKSSDFSLSRLNNCISPISMQRDLATPDKEILGLDSNKFQVCMLEFLGVHSDSRVRVQSLIDFDQIYGGTMNAASPGWFVDSFYLSAKKFLKDQG